MRALFLIPMLLGQPPVEFNRDVRPILSDRCFTCHGPDPANRKANLRFDVEDGAKAAIVPNDPASSPLIRRVASTNKALRMPPAYAGHDPLTPRQIDTLTRWIAEGARWQNHWSFIAPKRPPQPPVKAAAWPRNPIDYFVLARLEREGLAPSPEASKAALIRRLALDLTGLPPTPVDAAAFVKDDSPQAYERAVDRLLASPRYAERMAIRWLEAARYADTNGYQSDGVRTMWRWRDWVIDAYQRNMPFDQFTIEQLAGDLLPNATLSQRAATGFNRNHRTSAEGGIVDEEFRVEYVADRVETTSTVWLGLTMGCTRCHDHKYDPLKQRDFYSMFAFFNMPGEKGFVYNFGNEEPFITWPTAPQQKKLDALDTTLAGAKAKWDGLARDTSRAQRRWERSLRRSAATPSDWIPRESLAVAPSIQADAKGGAFDGRNSTSLGNDVAKFNHRDPLTLAAWFKSESPKGAILSRTEDYFEGTGYAIYLIDGKIRFHFVYRSTDLGMRIETRNPVKLNEWQHVAVTYDGSMKARNTHIYLNGVEQELNILFDQHLWPIDNKAPFRIGAGGGPEYGFKGEIKDVLVYRDALTPAQVSVLPLRENLNRLAAIPVGRRSKAQSAKLVLAFLDRLDVIAATPQPAAAKQGPSAADRRLAAARGAWRTAKSERDAYFATLPTSMVMADNGPPRDAFILRRGAYDARGEKVAPDTPGFLPPMPASFPRNRLGLARWLVDPANPLTARVAVNRYWQMLFGTGLVKTAEDFGSQGEWPVQPELLDWLAVEFRENGWNVKQLLKTIVMSAAYRQSSNVAPELLQRDPENRLFARGARGRLSAEMIRDQALAVSGLLVEQTGGPSVKPYQPAGLWQELTGGGGYKADTGEGLYRRGLYTYWRRTIAPPSMVNFDSPTRETCIVRESRTNTPLQALNLMNDVAFVEAARKLGERMLNEGGIDGGVRLVLAREPKPQESRILAAALDRFRARFAKDPAAAQKLISQGDSKPNANLDPVELAAYTSLGSLLLNLDETLTKE